MAAQVKNGTLTPNTVATVTVGPAAYVDVLNVDGAGKIYFTYDGSNAPPDPDTGGTADNNHCLPAAIGSFRVKANPRANNVLKLRSTAGPAYSVTTIPAGLVA